MPGVKHIIAVASGKGGVGKSTVACNLAVGLAKLGLKVGVLDADLFGPSMPKLFGIHSKPSFAPDGQKLIPLESYGVKVMSIGFLIDEGAPVVWRGPMVISALNQLLREVAWGDLDVLVVDMPPGTGDTQLTMAQNVPLAGAVIVSTPQDLALIDARRGIAMFNQVKVPLIGVIENMSYFVCPHCGERTDVFSHGGARKEAEKLGVPFLGEVPLDIAIRVNSDDGRPVVASHAGERASERLARDRDDAWRIRSPPARRAQSPRRASASWTEGAAMSWPTDITAMDKGHVLEVAFDDGQVIRLTAEKLRVESPSAEVQGHSPSQKKASPARKTSPLSRSSRSAITRSRSCSTTGTTPVSTPGTICASWRVRPGRCLVGSLEAARQAPNPCSTSRQPCRLDYARANRKAIPPQTDRL